MIHWLQTVLEKHFKWLFIILLAVIIVSFVFTIGAARGIGEPHEANQNAIFYGYDLSNKEIVEHLQKGAYLSQKLGTASFIMGMQGAEGIILSRAALLQLAKNLNIPSPDEANLKNFIQSQIPGFQNDKKQFDAQAYKKFLEEASANPDLGEALAAQFVREEFQIQKLKKLLEVSPSSSFDATYQWVTNHTQWEIEAAEIDASTMEPVAAATDEDLVKFYEDNQTLYERPAERQLTYVLFKAKDFEPKDAVNLQVLEEWYNTNTEALLLPKPDEVPELVPFASADHAAIEAAYKKEMGLTHAVEAADAFATALYENGISYKSGAFEQLLQKDHLTLETLPAFSIKQLPLGTPFSRRDLQQALSLDSKIYYSDVYELKEGLGIYFFDQEIPVMVEPLEKIKAKVVEDFDKKTQAEAFEAYAKQVAESLKSALVEKNNDFKEATESLSLVWKEWPAFTFEKGADDLPDSIMQLLGTVGMKEASPVQIDGTKAYVFWVRNKVLPTLTAEEKTKIQDEAGSMQKFMSMVFDSQTLQQIIMRGFPKAKKTHE